MTMKIEGEKIDSKKQLKSYFEENLGEKLAESALNFFSLSGRRPSTIIDAFQYMADTDANYHDFESGDVDIRKTIYSIIEESSKPKSWFYEEGVTRENLTKPRLESFINELRDCQSAFR